jgi:hypothetical protein
MFDVQVCYPEHRWRVTSRKDVTLTPLDVADALDEMSARIRREHEHGWPERKVTQ